MDRIHYLLRKYLQSRKIWIIFKSAFEEGNYTLAEENLNEIKSGNNWLNIQEELKSRNLVNQITTFNSFLVALNESIVDRNLNSTISVEQVKEDFEKIASILGTPVIDYHRLIISLCVIIIPVILLLYLIPKIRVKLRIKY